MVSLRNGSSYVLVRKELFAGPSSLLFAASVFVDLHTLECGVEWCGEPRLGQALLFNEQSYAIDFILTVKMLKRTNLLLSTASSSNCHPFAVVQNICARKPV